MSRWLNLLLVAGLLLTACTEEPAAAAAADAPPSAEVPPATPAEQVSLEALERQVAARKALGDTLPMDHEVFRAMVVDQLPGYELVEDNASTFRMGGYAFAESERVFFDAEQQYIEFTIGDYVQHPDFIEIMVERYLQADGQEEDGLRDTQLAPGQLRPDSTGHFFVISSFDDRKRIARLFMVWDYRIVVAVEATGQAGPLDPEQVSRWLDLNQLAAQRPS